MAERAQDVQSLRRDDAPGSGAAQSIAVKLYRTPDRLTLAAPVPGLLPQDITVEITDGGQLIVRGPLRGITADAQLFHRLDTSINPQGLRESFEETRESLLDEWTVGPYRRVIDLPNPVDGSLATATYGNGVLVITLRRSVWFQSASGGASVLGVWAIQFSRARLSSTCSGRTTKPST